MFGYRRDPCDSACGSKVKGWKMLEDVVSRSWSRFQVFPNYIPKNDPKWYRKILETNPSKMVPEFSQQHPPNQHWRQAHHPWRSALRMASWDCLEEDRLRGRGQLSWDAVFETQSYEEVEMCGWWWWWWFYGILWLFIFMALTFLNRFWGIWAQKYRAPKGKWRSGRRWKWVSRWKKMTLV